MKSLTLAGFAGIAALGAHAQVSPVAFQPSVDPLVVTASRTLAPSATLRDAVVITRDDLDAAGRLSLAEVLQREAGVELRSTGGAGQPQTIFIRGAGSAQTLVLVDGLRVGSATVGTTSIEHIPLEMIERIEVVKGPLSSLYGPEAIGGVIQIFTRGKDAPHLFAASAYGTDRDARVSAGLSTADEDNRLSLNMGARRVDPPSATNPRAGFLYNPDRDPYRNAFANLHASHRMWQGETLALDAFVSGARTDFDSGLASQGDRNDQTISGARLSSATDFAPWWGVKLAVGAGDDRLVTRGSFPGRIETRQNQASWVNELRLRDGTLVAGVETLRQRVSSDESASFTHTKRDTNSAFAGLNESIDTHHLEASIRRDDDDQFGARNTGSASYGVDWPGALRLSATYAKGFRAPTFFDLYGVFPGYKPNPDLKPERSKSTSVTVKSDARAAWQWRVTGFDNRLEDLVVFSAADSTVENVARARVRGVEAVVEGRWSAMRLRASFTAQRPRDQDTGARLQGRAERFGTLQVARDFGAWTAALTVVASGARFDSANQDPASRLPGYAVVDARVRYAFDKHWSAELAATNLGDRRYENAVGYDAPRRGVLLSLRFESY